VTDSDPFVVVGGDAAGLSAASKFARERTDSREVVVFERGRWVSFAHCGTPYYVKGAVDSLLDMTTLSPDEVEARGIDLRRSHEVTAVHPDRDAVRVAGPDGPFDQPFSALLVATGAVARTGPFDRSPDGVFTLHGMDDAAALRALVTPPGDPLEDGDLPDAVDRARVEQYADDPVPDAVAVVGGGYVGVEMAEAFAARGVDVHLFQRSAHVLGTFGEAAARVVEDALADAGVHLHLAGEVTEILTEDGRVTAVAHDGPSDDPSPLPVDAVLVGVGIAPAVDPVAGAGVALGDSGAIAVDRYGRTSRDRVYAAGDCAEARHVVTGDQTWVPLGLTANRAGRAVGATVAGDPTPTGGVAGTAAVKAFDAEAGRSGLVGDALARDAGFEPVTETVTAGSRSGYYPGATETTVTLTGDRGTGRLLGGAIAGTDRAAVRIDTVATALEAGLTVADLERADLAYAPPFSPVWDPVLVAAKVLNGRL
jgi:NADPH-dependent 2,4-dienoyl-CoA reductase/sulfur reductase-like enzyme